MSACGACFGKAIGREVIDKTLRAETRRGDRIVLLVETKTINTVTSPQITNYRLGVDDGCAPRAACLCAFLPACLQASQRCVPTHLVTAQSVACLCAPVTARTRSNATFVWTSLDVEGATGRRRCTQQVHAQNEKPAQIRFERL